MTTITSDTKGNYDYNHISDKMNNDDYNHTPVQNALPV